MTKLPELCLMGGVGLDDTGEGVSAKAFDADLKALGSPKAFLLRINSPGGSVFDGMAMYSMLKASRAKITARIEGIAASAASLIAMAADRIEIAENAFMLIHQPYTTAMGSTEDLATAAKNLELMTNQYVSIYSARSGKTPEFILSLMKEDRLMSAQEAVSIGLCDAVIDPANADVNSKYLPKHLREAVETAIAKGTDMAVTAKKTGTEAAIASLTEEIKALAAQIAAQAKAKAEDDDDAEASADENDDEPTNAKGKKAKAKADDDSDADAEDDDDMNAKADDEDEPKSRKAKASNGREYAGLVADLCEIAGKPDLIAGFIRANTPVADVRKALLKTRAATSNVTSNVRSADRPVKQEAADKSWDAVIAKMKR